jgi:anti-sigma-K factor RskA
VRGTGQDPGLGRYNEDGRDAVDGSSFWEDLLRFLIALLIIVTVLAIAAALGAALAAAAGPTVAVVAAAAGIALINVVGTA